VTQLGRIWWVIVVGIALIGTVLRPAVADASWVRPLNAVRDDAAAGGDDLAVVALREGCDYTAAALRWSGSNSHIVGAVHSNGGLTVSGSNNTVTGAVTAGCAADVSGQANALGPGPTLVEPMPSPVEPPAADIACDFAPPKGDLDRDGPWWEGGTRTSGRLLDGVYCAEGRLKLAVSGVSGRVTLIATGPKGEIRLSGSDLDLRPAAGNMLAYAEGHEGDAIKLSGSAGTWRGIVSAPNGNVAVSGSGGEVPSGLLIGNTITFSGSGWVITGLPVPPPTDVSDSTGAMLVQVYTCPEGNDDVPPDRDWFAVCTSVSDGVAFAVSPVGTDDAQMGTTDGNGQVIFAQLAPGTYRLDAVDAPWCHAKGDQVTPESEVVVTAGQRTTVWIFFCAVEP